MRITIFLLIGVLSIGLATVAAEERYSIARNADLVVVGHLRDVTATKHRDGWHFRARVVVTEVLFGRATRGQILAYRFACTCCPATPRPPLADIGRQDGLWFLLRTNSQAWGSAGTSCADPGFRPISDRNDMMKVLHDRKH
jgi:hypothetical protein